MTLNSQGFFFQQFVQISLSPQWFSNLPKPFMMQDRKHTWCKVFSYLSRTIFNNSSKMLQLYGQILKPSLMWALKSYPPKRYILFLKHTSFSFPFIILVCHSLFTLFSPLVQNCETYSSLKNHPSVMTYFFSPLNCKEKQRWRLKRSEFQCFRYFFLQFRLNVVCLFGQLIFDRWLLCQS